MTSLGLGVLSWKGHDSLEAALATYAEAGLFELFDERLLFLPEIDDRGRAIAARFDIPFAGSDKNLGILGGFKALASAMTADIVLLLENDCPLIEPRDVAEARIAEARRALEAGEVDVFRMRSRKRPGQRFQTLGKHLALFPPEDAPALSRAVAAAHRAVRPDKALRLAGGAVYAYDDPERRHPRFIERRAEGWWRVSSRIMTWTNQSIMIRRNFFLETIIARAEARPSSRTVNGFPDLEKEMNTPWWRGSGFRIGVGEGIFTHERV
ncbi:MAG: hypothetical protein AAFV51_03055 [Pseudomonadota bacterium]